MTRRNQRKTILLTGANGFLGSHFLRRLQNDRRAGKIVVLDIKRPHELMRNAKFFHVDLTEPGIDKAVAEILIKEHADTIVHMAFHSSPRHDERMSHELTVIGTLNMLKACDRAPVRKLVVQSTTLVYGASYRNPSLLDENHPPNGAGSYAFIRDKVEVESMLQRLARSCPETIITALRFCPILSRQHSDYITEFLERSLVLTALGYDPLVQFLHPEDALVALKKAVDVDAPGAINIVGSGVLYLSTVLHLAEKRAVPVLSPLASPLVDVLWYLKMSEAPGTHLDYLRYSCIASGEKAEKGLGFSPKYSTKETLLAYLGKDS
ncbi:MAG: NAD-dependent epimerase/dehydratase family protein [Acidobacteria bacterium]|nr:NAD-dependent epimerase/dehydratase family protein [Acidobacteriota bacterium]